MFPSPHPRAEAPPTDHKEKKKRLRKKGKKKGGEEGGILLSLRWLFYLSNTPFNCPTGAWGKRKDHPSPHYGRRCARDNLSNLQQNVGAGKRGKGGEKRRGREGCCILGLGSHSAPLRP